LYFANNKVVLTEFYLMKPHRNRRSERKLSKKLPTAHARNPAKPLMGPEGLVLESESTRSAEKILSQLQSVIDDFSKEYPQHTRSIPIPRPGEDPLIAFVRSMAQSMANKEKQLERLHEQALETVKAEQRFLANMSHEVRTPMNAIFGLVALLLEMDLSPVSAITSRLFTVKANFSSTSSMTFLICRKSQPKNWCCAPECSKSERFWRTFSWSTDPLLRKRACD